MGKVLERITDDQTNTKGAVKARILSKFALKLAADFLQKGGEFDEATREMLERNSINLSSFFNVLFQLMFCNYEEISLNALQLIESLEEKKYPIDILNQSFFDGLIRILSKLGPKQMKLIDVVFKLLSKVFQAGIPDMKHSQYEIMFFSLNEYLLCSEFVKFPLKLLQVLIEKQFIQPQIYDLINKVFDYLFQTQAQAFCEEAKTLLLLFVTKFPITKDLLLQYTATLFNNISFQNDSVRMQVLLLIKEIFQKYSFSFFSEFQDVFFLQLITSLVNEKEAPLREQIRDTL